MSISDWPCAPLEPAALAALDTRNWKAFPKATVQAVAEAWNAGMTTADMAVDLECRPASLRMLIGALTQCGVPMRPAKAPGLPNTCRGLPRSEIATKIGQEQVARLRHLAPFDATARRTLALMGEST